MNTEQNTTEPGGTSVIEEKQPIRTDQQRRRLLIAAIAGAPMIVATSAQTARAHDSGQAHTHTSTGS